MNRKMYFGTRDKMSWIPCPAVDRPASNVGWSNSLQLLNGGNATIRSKGSHREFEMAWNLISREDAGRIEAFASGAYGDGPYYWSDPMSMEYNVLPPQWASPALSSHQYGGVNISGQSTFSVTDEATPENNYDYPTRSLSIWGFGGATPNGVPIWIPIPPGHTAHIGVHGGTASGVILTPDGGSPIQLEHMAETTSERTNTSVDGNVTGGFTLEVGSLSGDRVNLRISGMIVQILPNGVSPDPGGWIPGMGHSGCEFEEFPERVDYSSVFDKVGVTAVLKEVGSWL